jgi:hypothetical protein
MSSPPFPRSSLIGLALLAGCVHASFVPTGSGPPRRNTNPKVFVDHLPDRPYQSIGIIEVSGPPAQMDLATVMFEAHNAGAEAGCDVVVDRSIHRISFRREERAHLILAQYRAPYITPTPYHPAAPMVTPVYTPPPDRREFVCGIYVVMPPPAVAPPAESPYQPAPPT